METYSWIRSGIGLANLSEHKGHANVSFATEITDKQMSLHTAMCVENLSNSGELLKEDNPERSLNKNYELPDCAG